MAIRASGYTTFTIGPNQELTPEGFLLCKDVPVARTGVMIYGPDETPIEPGKDGTVKISREDEDVFNDRTIASAIGKPVTNDHPDDDVIPETWKELAHGVALNVRRGTGAMDDLLLMDLLITTKEGIEAVQNGKREISLGYDADYEETEPGKGRQSNIIINHIALVEQGRCGSRCAIKDELPTILTQERQQMANRYDKKPAVRNKKGLAKVMDLLFRANKARDAEELNDIINEAAEDADFNEQENVGNLDEMPAAEGGDTHIHIHSDGSKVTAPADDDGELTDGGEESDKGGRASFTDDDIQEHMDRNQAEHQAMMARLDALEAKAGISNRDEDTEEMNSESLDDGEDLEEFLEEEKPEGIAAKDARKARDSRYLGESMKNTIAMAEIIAPGIRVPTYDRMSKPSITAKKICSLRKKALDAANLDNSTKHILTAIMGGKTLDTSRMTCDAARVLFSSAAAMKSMSNNSQGVRDSIKEITLQGAAKKPATIEEINIANAAYYASQK